VAGAHGALRRRRGRRCCGWGAWAGACEEGALASESAEVRRFGRSDVSDVESESAESADERRRITPPGAAWWSESEPAAASSSSEAERRERRAAIRVAVGRREEGVKDRPVCVLSDRNWCTRPVSQHYAFGRSLLQMPLAFDFMMS